MSLYSNFLTPRKASIASGILIVFCLFVIFFIVQTIILPLATPWRDESISWQSFEKQKTLDKYKLDITISEGWSYNNQPTFLDSDNLNIRLNHVTLPDNMQTELTNKTCLDSVSFGWDENNSDSETSSGGGLSYKDVCSPYGTPDVWYGDIEEGGFPSTVIKPFSIINPFYYPFDTYRIRVPFRVNYRENRPDDLYGFSVAPEISLFVDVSGWIPSIIFGKYQSTTFENQADVSFVQVDFSRSPIYKIMPIVLFGLIFVFIVSIIFVSDLGNILQVAVGVLFSLWGVRSILIPNGINGFSLTDVLIISEYIFLALAIFIRFTIRPAIEWLGTISHPANNSSNIAISEINNNLPIESPENISFSHQKPKPQTQINYSFIIIGIIMVIGVLKFIKRNKYSNLKDR